MPRSPSPTTSGRFYARRYAFPPMVGRLLGYLAVCDPPEQTIGELAEALLASRSAITGAVGALETMHVISRSRSAGERMDRVRIDMSSPESMGMDISEYEELGSARTRRPGGAARRPRRTAGDPLGDVRVRRFPGGACRDHRAGMEGAARRSCRLRGPARTAPPRAGTVSGASQPAIVAAGVRKSFDAKVVLDGVDLTVAEGTVFALLGPNGAGKTTMIRILSTLIAPDAGRARVAGHDVVDDPDEVRAAIGVTGQFSALDELLTGVENLRLMADLNHLGRSAGWERVGELLDEFGLADAAHKPVSTYSGGMRRRLDLAMTLVGSPKVIFLDEPTAGLDPVSRRSMWGSIRELVAGGVTIFLTTQYLDEADELADQIAVLDHGRIVAEGTSDELKRRIPGGHVRLQVATPSALRAAVDLLDGASSDEEELQIQVPTDGTVASLRHLLGLLDNAGIEVEHLSIHTPDLDDVFFAVTGHPTEEALALP